MDELLEILKEIQEEAPRRLDAVNSLGELQELKALYLGRKRGKINEVQKGIGKLSVDQKRIIGAKLNEVKQQLEQLFVKKERQLKELAARAKQRETDITLPGDAFAIGSLHPVTKAMDHIVDIFVRMGFKVAYGPEVETDYYNFVALNTPKDHPARDLQDTFYISDDIVLRTHTSPMQIRVMEKIKPPLAYVFPGFVFRRDSDVSHTPMFSQVEGLMVAEQVTFSHLKGVLSEFARLYFGQDVKTRFRPHYFPFTEPSAEMDVSCVICKGKGCRVCKGSGWLEILGAGMVDPNVFDYVSYDNEQYTGFAFGMGVERIAMLKYNVDDLRLFYRNDLRFLGQFSL